MNRTCLMLVTVSVILFAGIFLGSTEGCKGPSWLCNCVEHAFENHNITKKWEFFFQCDLELNATKCLPFSTVGNGTEECLDGFDETPLAKKALRVITHAEQHSQEVDNSTTGNDEACQFTSMPKYCFCKTWSYVTCSGHGFTEAEVSLFRPASHVWHLNISDTNFEAINNTTFLNFTKLSSLVARNNELSTIAVGAFKDQGFLFLLNLQYNKISSLEPGTFDYLERLNTLILDGNQLSDLHVFNSSYNLTALKHLSVRENLLSNKALPFVPRGIQWITNLTLSHNYISNISQWPLKQFSELTTLDLAYNKLTSFDHQLLSLRFLRTLRLEGNYIANLQVGQKKLEKLETLNLARNGISRIDATFLGAFPNLRELDLSHNFIVSVKQDTFMTLNSLSHLVLSHNRISSLAFLSSLSLTPLQDLKINDNVISQLNSNAFEPVANLTKLDLSNNPVARYSSDVFEPLGKLQKLYMGGITFPGLNTELCSPLTSLQVVEFKTYSYCRFASQVEKCIYGKNPEGISSFFNLIDSLVLRGAVWIVASLTCVGNAIVIYIRLFVDKPKDKTLPIIHLAMADILMGIYLFILAAKDVSYRENYNAHALAWTNSWICKAAGFLVMTSCEQTVLMLCFMALERFLVITMPLKFRSIKKSVLRAVCVLLWILSIVFSILPLLPIPKLDGFYGKSDVCFPLFIANPTDTGWEYSIFLLVGINSAAVILLFISYSVMFYNIYLTRSNCGVSMSRERSLVIRLFFIVLTDIICWIPVIILKIMVTAGPSYFQISSSAHAWISIVVVPINSAVNPWLYTFSTRTFNKQVIEARSSLRRRLSRSSSQGSELRHRGSTYGFEKPNLWISLKKMFKREDSASTTTTVTSLRSRDSVQCQNSVTSHVRSKIAPNRPPLRRQLSVRFSSSDLLGSVGKSERTNSFIPLLECNSEQPTEGLILSSTAEETEACV